MVIDHHGATTMVNDHNGYKNICKGPQWYDHNGEGPQWQGTTVDDHNGQGPQWTGTIMVNDHNVATTKVRDHNRPNSAHYPGMKNISRCVLHFYIVYVIIVLHNLCKL